MRNFPIVNNGKIEQVLVTNGGYEYNSPPNLLVNGAGKFAKLTPVISEGQINELLLITPELTTQMPQLLV